jgi:hypothetical protein
MLLQDAIRPHNGRHTATLPPPETWPSAAWYLKGRGRWGVLEMSEAPEKSRYVPLGEFVTRLGPAPPAVTLVTYLQRLKEQGWDVSRTVRKLHLCGALKAGGLQALQQGGNAGEALGRVAQTARLGLDVKVHAWLYLHQDGETT